MKIKYKVITIVPNSSVAMSPCKISTVGDDPVSSVEDHLISTRAKPPRSTYQMISEIGAGTNANGHCRRHNLKGISSYVYGMVNRLATARVNRAFQSSLFVRMHTGVAPLVKTDFSSGLSGSAWAVDSDVLFILDLRQWSWTRAVCRVQRQKLRLFFFGLKNPNAVKAPGAEFSRYPLSRYPRKSR
jgi:hypothetical protein